MFYKTDLNRLSSQPSDTYSLERLADELILKGALLLGAGLGLYVTLRLLKGEKSPQH
jgi:hypothetical protein